MSEQLKFKTSDYAPTKDTSLNWIFIDQPGKPSLAKDKDGNVINRLVASCSLPTDSAGCKALVAAIDAFWKENKPKGAKCKSKGYRVVKDRNPDFDEDDDNSEEWITSPDNLTSFSFWTGTHYKDGNVRTLDIYNAKGSKVSLGGKKIGNGSKGAISGTMAIYDNGPAARGVTLYLNAIQLTHFVEYADDAGFDEEDGFEGVESEFDGTSEEDNTAAKPRL